MDNIDVRPAPSYGLALGLHNPDRLTSFVSAQTVTPQAKPVKRALDFVGAVALLVMLLPLLLCLALAVWANRDGGTILYRQKRIGRGGQVFNCLKFRTMCVNADQVLRELLATDPGAKAEWDESCKLQSDPRITPLGRLLRLCSFDEIPQLWNVLVGDMSLVGPRPITQAEIDGPYTKFAGRQDYLSVRPGITGLWQVSGRSGVSYEQRVELDKAYVRNLSLSADIVILLRTVLAVLRRDGAY